MTCLTHVSRRGAPTVNAVALVFCTAVFCAIVTSFPLGQVSHVVLVCFTVPDKVVPRRMFVNFTALNIVFQGLSTVLYSSYSRKGSMETEGVVNKEINGVIKGTNSSV